MYNLRGHCETIQEDKNHAYRGNIRKEKVTQLKLSLRK